MESVSPFAPPPAQSANDLVAEANHRVANSLALLGGLVRMQARAAGKSSRAFSNAQIRMMFDGIAARIATIGQLHRMLATIPMDGTIPLDGHLRQVCASLIAAFSCDQQQVHIEHEGGECLVLAKHVQPLTLILCEILTNSIKYAHPAGVEANLKVACESQQDGTLVMIISDDGVGLPEGFDPLKDGGIGFQVIRALSADMGARLNVTSDNLGLTFRLTLPQALVANARSA